MSEATGSLVGVIGASGFTGSAVTEILAEQGYAVQQFSRAERGAGWQLVGPRSADRPPIALWILACRIDSVAEHREMLLSYGAKRIVAISSTSIFTKGHSGSASEQQLIAQLKAGEADLAAWAAQHGIDWIMLRPTLIYGRGRDKNVSEIARLIRRFGFFPLFGAAEGRRQPIHVMDLAAWCVAALSKGEANRAYNVSGAEVLSYTEMVRRIFAANRRPAVTPHVPLALFRLALTVANRIPRFSHWTADMAERMNKDMVFDNSEAIAAFGVQPRPFTVD